MFLVADLAESQLETRNKVELPFFSNPLFLKSVVDLTASTDLDLQEKVYIFLWHQPASLQLANILSMGLWALKVNT